MDQNVKYMYIVILPVSIFAGLSVCWGRATKTSYIFLRRWSERLWYCPACAWVGEEGSGGRGAKILQPHVAQQQGPRHPVPAICRLHQILLSLQYWQKVQPSLSQRYDSRCFLISYWTRQYTKIYKKYIVIQLLFETFVITEQLFIRVFIFYIYPYLLPCRWYYCDDVARPELPACLGSNCASSAACAGAHHHRRWRRRPRPFPQPPPASPSPARLSKRAEARFCAVALCGHHR